MMKIDCRKIAQVIGDTLSGEVAVSLVNEVEPSHLKALDLLSLVHLLMGADQHRSLPSFLIKSPQTLLIMFLL